MADIELIPIMPAQVGDRPVLNTGVSMLGRGGDNFICGHCGRVMIHSFPLAALQADTAYQCEGCEGYNLKPKEG